MNLSFGPNAERGLSAQQVAEKRSQGRQNTQPEKATKSTGQILKDNICTLFNLFNALIAICLLYTSFYSPSAGITDWR